MIYLYIIYQLEIHHILINLLCYRKWEKYENNSNQEDFILKFLEGKAHMLNFSLLSFLIYVSLYFKQLLN